MKILFKQDVRASTNIKNPQTIIAYFNGYKDGKPTKIQVSTGLKVMVSKFSGGKVVNVYEKREINSKLQKMEVFFNEEVDNCRNLGITPDKATLNRAIRRAKGLVADKPEVKFVLDYLDEFLQKTGSVLNAKGQLGLGSSTVSNYGQLYNALKIFEILRTKQGYSKATVKSVDISYFKLFREYLVDDREYRSSTINTRIKDLKALGGHAKDDGLEVSSAFKDFRNTRRVSKSEENIYLTDEELDLLTKPNDELSDTLEKVRRIAIIMAETGARISEVLGAKKTKTEPEHPPLTPASFIKDVDGDLVAVIQQKKTFKEVQVPILSERAIEVVNTGLFDKISHQKFNEYLKELGKVQGIHTIMIGELRGKTEKGTRKKVVEGSRHLFLHAHALRKTKLTNLFHKGVPENLLMLISGHTKADLLYDYIGVRPSKERQLAELKSVLLKIN